MLIRRGCGIFNDWQKIRSQRLIPIVDINEVGNAYIEWNMGKNVSVCDFHNIKSPWPKAWFERKVRQWKGHDWRVGVLLYSYPCHAQEDLAQELADDLCFSVNLDDYVACITAPIPAMAHWLQTAIVFLEPDEAIQSVKPIYLVTHALDSQGKILKGSEQIFLSKGIHGATSRYDNMRFYANMLFPVLFSISFLHCKNVEVTDVLTGKHKMKTESRGGIVFKTLRIKPATCRSSGGLSLCKSTDKLRHHIVRGHFAHYVDKPAFGTVYGTFWIPDHARGGRRAGEVRKDYRV